jgi:large subunit ribosomal protein L15
MVVNKRKKNSRLRGSWTHGWGEKKKHRGAGSRGGRGMAGTGKRGDAKKPSIWGERYFGKFGFIKKNKSEKIVAINVSDIERKLDSWVKEKLVSVENNVFVVDSAKLGFNKVLGTGTVSKRLKISCPFFSAGTVEKIKAAGGEVVSNKEE